MDRSTTRRDVAERKSNGVSLSPLSEDVHKLSMYLSMASILRVY